MKDQFEAKIKELVEEFSYDYEPKAWESLSKKLPQANTGLSWLGKVAIAAILSIGLIAIWYNFSPKNDRSNQADRIVKKKFQNTEQRNPSASQKAQKNTTPTKPNTNQNISTLAPNNVTNQSWTQMTQEVVADPEWNLPPVLFKQQELTFSDPNEQLNADTDLKSQHDAQNLANDQNNHQAPGAVATPCKVPKIILDADAINYEEGTPRIHINAENTGADITWSANGTLMNQTNRGADLLAFQGQTYTITAVAQLDGCQSTEKIKVTANDDYNLLAVNAFNPASRDERNATFMPYALTIREVRFELLIIDPDNGGLVFKTTDAQNPWTGIDQRNGQLVGAQKAFIWKVTLQQVLPNEKTTYSGTIVRI
jgi:cytoskeletal protein RodZ